VKNILLILWLLSVGTIYAQQKEPSFPVKDGKVFYEDIVDVKGATQDQLYQRCRAWFAKSFKSANDVLQLDTKDELIGKAIWTYSVYMGLGKANVDVEFMILVKIKEGRYMCQITDFKEVGMSRSLMELISDDKVFKENGKPRKMNMDYRTETIRAATLLLLALQWNMEGSAAEDGW